MNTKTYNNEIEYLNDLRDMAILSWIPYETDSSVGTSTVGSKVTSYKGYGIKGSYTLKAVLNGSDFRSGSDPYQVNSMRAYLFEDADGRHYLSFGVRESADTGDWLANRLTNLSNYWQHAVRASLYSDNNLLGAANKMIDYVTENFTPSDNLTLLGYYYDGNTAQGAAAKREMQAYTFNALGSEKTLTTIFGNSISSVCDFLVDISAFLISLKISSSSMNSDYNKIIDHRYTVNKNGSMWKALNVGSKTPTKTNVATLKTVYNI